VAGRITALRRERPGRVALEVDGRRWRVVPDDVVVRCGLVTGVELERSLLRELRRELRRAEALAAATRALARRDLSRRRLDERLRARGASAPERERAVATLEAAGLVDDARLARRRSEDLAERGWGDAAIAARLERDGVTAELARSAIADLAPEGERAVAVARQVSDRHKAWKLLSRRGFSADSAESALGPLDEEPSTGLG
jgi:SOS response regulatory protein OraA/RecX